MSSAPLAPVARSAQRAMNAWFIAIFILFFTRGLFYATWSTRGPQLRDALHLDLAAMGWYAACLSLGSVTGVLVSERIVRRFGVKRFSIVMYIILGVALTLLGLNLAWENVAMAYVVTAILGFPFGATDYSNNLEAAKINNESGKNRVPALHGGYSTGVLLGAALVGLVITIGIGVTPNFIAIALFVLVVSVIAALFIKDVRPKKGESAEIASPGQVATAEDLPEPLATAPVDQKVSQRVIWGESRSRHIGFIGFAFVFVEGAGAVWIPIALVQFGFTPADAAFSYTLFGLGFVIVRFIGGPLADKLGRQKIVLFSAITAILGIGIFMATPFIHVPLIGALLWGVGDSIGLAMCVAAFGDDPTRVGSRMTFLWTLVYMANLVVGPIIGTLSSLVGLIWTFTLPIALMIYSAFASRAVRHEELPVSAASN